MAVPDPSFQVRLAADDLDLMAAQRLRYRVFVQELGANGPLVDHVAQLERDRFDPFFDHLLLIDTNKDPKLGEHVVGVYRLMPGARADQAGGFYSESEYDLTVLRQSGRPLLELGRSCVHPHYRGGAGMVHLWAGLADYVLERGIEVRFGVASFHGTDLGKLAPALSYLHQMHLAPEGLRVTARGPQAHALDTILADQIDRPAALRAMPALIKAYLRLGGFVGNGAFVDRAFNTTDVCLVMDTAQMSERHRAFYTRKSEDAGGS